MEPVELDFIYGGNTDTEGPKIEQGLDNITEATKRAQAGFKQSVAEQKAVVAQIEADIKKLESQMKNAAPGEMKSNLTQEITAAKQALAEEKAALQQVEVQADATAKSHVRLRTQVMEAKQALAEMEMAGKRGTPEYAAAAKALGMLNDQMSDTNSQATILADDEKGFKAVTNTVSGMAGAMTAAVGVASLFGAENEELARIQTRLQAVMAITIGLQQVAEMLNKDSYFSVVLLTKAKTAWAAANLRVATTLGITTAASRALMISGIGVVLVGIIALVSWYDKYNKKLEDNKKLNEERAKFQSDLQKDISEGYSKEQATIEAMRASLNSENVSRTKKLGIIKQLKEMIPGYTAQLSNEGTVINENKKAIDNYMASLEKSLKLRATEKELAAIYEKKYNLQKLVVPEEKPSGPFAIQQKETPEQKLKRQLSEGAKRGIALLDKQAQEIKDYIETEGLITLDQNKKVKEKTAKEEYNAEKNLQSLLLDIKQQTSDLLLEQQQDSLKKRLEQVENEKNAELKAIQDKEISIIEAYNKSNKDKKGFKALSTKTEDIQTSLQSIDPELAKSLQAATVGVVDAYGIKATAVTKKWTEELLSLAGKFADERVQIEKDYNEIISKLQQEGQTEAANLAIAERDKKKSDITIGLLEETKLYKAASNDKLELSRQTTELLIADLQKRIEAEIAAGNITKEQGEKWLNNLKTAQKNISENKDGEKNQNNPFAQLGSAIGANKAAKDAVKNFDATGMSPAEAGVALDGLKAKAKLAGKEMAAAAGAALQGVNAILGSVVNGLDELGMLTEEEKKTANEVVGMVSGAANIAMGLATGNPMQIIQGSIDLIVNGIKLFDQKSRDIEKAQKRAKENLDDLARAYKNLQRAVEDALGTDVYTAQKREIENLRQQIFESQRLIFEEQKKAKKKQDAEAIANWRAQIDDLNAQIKDITDAITESLAGTDAQSLASQLGDALVEAFQNGSDAAEAMGNVVNDVLRNAVTNALKLQFLEKPMQAAVEKLAENMKDNTLTEAESKQFEDAIRAAGEQYYSMLAQYSDLFTEAGTGGATGIKGDFAKMTEDTASALLGQFTAIRLNVAEIVANSKNGAEVMSKQLAALEAIRNNTEYCRRLDRIDDTLYYIKINGVKLS